MDRLEKYLEEVCRGIGGPLEMRRHLRQELREHLLDAVAQHKAAGLADEAALTKAIEEFGQPDEVRTGLEATHGRRMNWIIEKAMQWKERTMKAKWLWTTWVHTTLLGAIALEALLITFIMVMIVPKFYKLMQDGFIDPAILQDHEIMWLVNFLDVVQYATRHHTILWVVIPAALWGLFEWRVKNENKTFMRLSALGTIAVALLIVIILAVGALVISFTLGMPAMGVMARPWAVEQVGKIEASVGELEKAMKNKDWPAMYEHAKQADTAALLLAHGPAVTSLVNVDKEHDVRTHFGGVRYLLTEVQKAIRDHDQARLDAALVEFHKSFEVVRAAAKKVRQ